MEETEVDTYKLNTENTNQSLRISLINNEQISMIVENMTNNQKYTTLVTFPQLKKVCQIFSSLKNIQESLQLLKDTIESGNIMITEDAEENTIELRYNIILENEEEAPFDIQLALEKPNNQEEDVQILPPKFDYQGNKEAESKYGNSTNNTTEFVNPIVKSDVKPPILQLEYIEPILQVHYPDGTTKSTALPPRIQGANGETPNITEEQFKSIQEQMNTGGAIRNFSPLKEFLNNNRSNSVAKKNMSMYSTLSTPYPAVTNINTVNPFNNNEIDNQRSVNTLQNSFNNTYNGDLNKISSGYSVMTMQARNYTTYGNNNFNTTNVYQSNMLNPKSNTIYNNVIERRPRMIKKKMNPKDAARSLSTPHQDIYNNYRQPNQSNNPFQTSYYDNQTTNPNQREKYPYDRDTRHRINKRRKNRDGPQNSLSHIERQQQRLLEVQRKLAQIQLQQQQLQARQRELILQNPHIPSQGSAIKKIPKQPVRQNLQFNQSKIRKAQSQSINYNEQSQFQSKNQVQGQIRQTNSFMNNQQFLQNQNSGDIKQSKTQMIRAPNRYKKQSSTPISSQAPTLGNKDISQQLISLAQMASMQNEANPEFKNLQAITLQQQSQNIQSEEQGEVQEYQPQQEEIQQQQYESGVENVEEQQQVASDQNINVEALFFTEDGRVIFRNGLLRGIIHRYAEIDEVVTKIQDILLKGVKFNLIYKAFDDGDKAKIFHEKCDKYKMSLVLIETDQDVRFGGFTTKSWEGRCLKKIDNDAFVFSLETNKIYDIIKDEPAIGCYPKFGPVFFGCQIRIYDDFFSKGGTTCHKGLNYKTKKDFELNNGEQQYLIKDIEVYSIETIDI